MDSITEILIASLVSAPLTFVLYYLINLKRGNPDVLAPNAYLLKPTFLYIVFGAIFLLFPVGMFFAYLTRGESIMLIFLTAFILIFIPSGYFFLKIHKTHRVFYDNDGLIVTTILGETKTLKWNEIESARYHNLKGNFELKGKGQTLNVQPFMHGISHFLNLLIANTGLDKAKLKSQYVSF